MVSDHDDPNGNLPGIHNWRERYEQAMLETDSDQIVQRIQAAELIIIQRSRELAIRGVFNEEDRDLTSAIVSLCDLRRKMNGKHVLDE
jgi:hypothetical protein